MKNLAYKLRYEQAYLRESCEKEIRFYRAAISTAERSTIKGEAWRITMAGFTARLMRAARILHVLDYPNVPHAVENDLIVFPSAEEDFLLRLKYL